MSETKRFRLVYVADAMLGLLILCGAAIYVSLPWTYDRFIEQNFEEFAAADRNLSLGLLYASGLPAIALLVLALIVLINVTRNKPFVMENARLLRWMGVLAAVIGVEFLCTTFFASHSAFRLLTIAVFAVFILLAVLVWVFADLFRTAVEYKEENELTI